MATINSKSVQYTLFNEDNRIIFVRNNGFNITKCQLFPSKIEFVSNIQVLKINFREKLVINF